MSASQQWMDKLFAVECPDSTYHPLKEPLIFEKGAGSYLWDIEGRKYIDFCAGFGVLAMGHAPASTREVLREYASDAEKWSVMHGMGDVYPSRTKIELLTALRELLPSFLSKGMLALTGGQAVELAIKTALVATKRSGFIAFNGAYHGLDLGILPFCSREDFKAPFKDWVPGDHIIHVDFGCSEDAITGAIARLCALGVGFAGIVVEPVQGRAGIKKAPTGWLEMLRKKSSEAGGLLIYDEIFTGLGRTGCITHAELVPCDLLCLGKALGGGLPLSACFGTDDVMSKWPANKGEAVHTGTFFGHPLSCATAHSFLQALQNDNLCARSRDLGNEVMKFLKDQIGGSSIVREIRGEGLMVGVEFTQDGLGAVCMDELRAEGVILLANGPKGEGVSITPALNISEEILSRGLKIFSEWVRQRSHC